MTKDPIYDAILRNLIYESQIYQQEHESLMKSQDESIYMKNSLEKLLKHLESLEDFEKFNPGIFKDIIERGVLHEIYRIEFIFKCGIKRMAYGWRRGKEPVEPLNQGVSK